MILLAQTLLPIFGHVVDTPVLFLERLQSGFKFLLGEARGVLGECIEGGDELCGGSAVAGEVGVAPRVPGEDLLVVIAPYAGDVVCTEVGECGERIVAARDDVAKMDEDV
jgi:hypothetical protein